MKRFLLVNILFAGILAGCSTVTGPITGTKYSNYHYYPKFPPQYYREVYVSEHPALSQDLKDHILNGELMIGMTKEEALVIVAFPSEPIINRTVTQNGVSEQYVFRFLKTGTLLDSTKDGFYLYFDNDKLTAWQT